MLLGLGLMFIFAAFLFGRRFLVLLKKDDLIN
jgi:hypothetical protein